MVLVAKPMFWGMENHLGPFSEASDQPEGQELGGGAVGGQEELQDENCTSIFEKRGFYCYTLYMTRVGSFVCSSHVQPLTMSNLV